MNKNCDNRNIRVVTWPDSGSEQGRCVRTDCLGRIRAENEFHGEYDDWWIVEYDEHGKEIARHNAKFIESVIWMEPLPVNLK